MSDTILFVYVPGGEVDPITAAIALLAPFLAKGSDAFASKAGEAAFEATKNLFATIRRRLTAGHDAKQEATLTAFIERPEDESTQEAAADAINQVAARDPDFRSELERLVNAASGGQPIAKFLNQVYGGEVGKIINIDSVQTLNLS